MTHSPASTPVLPVGSARHTLPALSGNSAHPPHSDGPLSFPAPRSATLRVAPQRFATQRNDFLSIFRTHLPLPSPRFAPQRHAALRYASQRNELFFTFQISNDSARNYSNRYEAAILPDAARRTGAAMNGRDVTAPPCAVQPRPLPLHEINHSAHAVSLSSLARNSEPKRSLFRVFGKEIHDRRAC